MTCVPRRRIILVLTSPPSTPPYVHRPRMTPWHVLNATGRSASTVKRHLQQMHGFECVREVRHLSTSTNMQVIDSMLRVRIRHQSYQGLILDRHLCAEPASRCAFCNTKTAARVMSRHYTECHPDLTDFGKPCMDRVRWAANFGSGVMCRSMYHAPRSLPSHAGEQTFMDHCFSYACQMSIIPTWKTPS